MNYQHLADHFSERDGVEKSTMMGTPCLRYRGNFIGMMFDKEGSLIVKLSPQRVNEIIADGLGKEFNFTKKRFKEWVLIPLEFEEKYADYLEEALKYAKTK